MHALSYGSYAKFIAAFCSELNLYDLYIHV